MFYYGNTNRCFPKNELFPPENPIICQQSEAVNTQFVIKCCNNKDYCNLKLSPTLAPQMQNKGKTQ